MINYFAFSVKNLKKNKGFTLVELLITIAIVGILAAIVFAFLNPAGVAGRDAARKQEIAQFGRFLSIGCYVPDGGPGEYDIADLAIELSGKFPQYSDNFNTIPKDPATGSDIETNYKYIVANGGNSCVLYANLENEDEEVSLSSLSEPTPGGGTGVLQGGTGWNNSTKYFQVGY